MLEDTAGAMRRVSGRAPTARGRVDCEFGLGLAWKSSPGVGFPHLRDTTLRRRDAALRKKPGLTPAAAASSSSSTPGSRAVVSCGWPRFRFADTAQPKRALSSAVQRLTVARSARAASSTLSRPPPARSNAKSTATAKASCNGAARQSYLYDPAAVFDAWAYVSRIAAQHGLGHLALARDGNHPTRALLVQRPELQQMPRQQ